MLRKLRHCCKRYAGRPVLETGDAIPEVTAVDEEGRERRLGEEAGQGWALVYFYPRAQTPGCTMQACSLRDAYEELEEHGVKVYGVSTDSVARQKKFRERRKLPFTLLADADRRVIEAFGVPTMFGFASRMAFLFRDGRLVWRDLHASTIRQAADILAIVRGEESAED